VPDFPGRYAAPNENPAHFKITAINDKSVRTASQDLAESDELPVSASGPRNSL